MSADNQRLKGATAPGPGHNLASPLDLIRERVLEEILPACNEWNAVSEIADEEQARRCDDILSKLTAELKLLATNERAEKKPLRDAIDKIGERYGDLRLMLATAKGLIEPKAEKWLQRKRDEIRAEKARQQAEADRLAREAFKANANAVPGSSVEKVVAARRLQEQADDASRLAAQPEARAQVRGQYSERARSLRKFLSAEVDDVLLCLIYFQDHPDVRELLTKLASAEARAGARDIPGCRVIEREVAA